MDTADDLTPEAAKLDDGFVVGRTPKLLIAARPVLNAAGEVIGFQVPTLGDDDLPAAWTAAEKADAYDHAAADMPMDDPRGARSARYFRRQARTIRFEVEVPPRGEKTIVYTARYTW